jgi:nucleotide-binding universal stress UspA family protein
VFRKILLCTDFSENSHWAFHYALDLAKAYKSKMLILHIVPESPHPEQPSAHLSEEKLEELKAARKKEMDLQLRTHYLDKMKRFKDYQFMMKTGDPFDGISETAKEEAVDLIVMGTHGRTGLDHVLFGSTSEKVVRMSSCPVLIVRFPGKSFLMP